MAGTSKVGCRRFRGTFTVRLFGPMCTDRSGSAAVVSALSLCCGAEGGGLALALALGEC